MKTEVAECKIHCGEWLVETIGSDGEVYMARFSGPDSELRAKRYATTFAWYSLRQTLQEVLAELQLADSRHDLQAKIILAIGSPPQPVPRSASTALALLGSPTSAALWQC